jgi:hypothetical protein
MQGEESRLANAGFVATYLYRMDVDPNEYHLGAIFGSKEGYVRNADSPEQDASFRRMLEFLEGEKEWHDGEIVYSTLQKHVIEGGLDLARHEA